jgi:thiol:disulfide interchange protein
VSWTEDVEAGLARLDATPRALRSFGLVLGGVLLALAAWLLWRGRPPAAWLAAGLPGALLAALGLLAPAALRGAHRAWMALALALGWVTSRLVLLLVFSLLLTPLALAARLLGKRFLAMGPDPRATSYWVARPPDRRDDYTKMY